MPEIIARVRCRSGTSSAWTFANPIPKKGEICIEYGDLDPTLIISIRVGNNIQAWADLLPIPYALDADLDTVIDYIVNEVIPVLPDHEARLLVLEDLADDFEGGINPYQKSGTDTYQSWYSNAITNIASFTNAGLGANAIRAIPFIIKKACTLSGLQIRITIAGSAGSLARLMIYNSVNNIPGALVLDAGTVPISSLGAQTILVNQALDPGLYFFCLWHNSAAVTNFRAGNVDAFPSVLGMPADVDGTVFREYNTVLSFGSAPANHPAVGAPTANTNAIIIIQYSLQ